MGGVGDGNEVTYLFWGDRPLVGLPELLNHSGVAPEILLAADKQHWQTSAEVRDLRVPLFQRMDKSVTRDKQHKLW